MTRSDTTHIELAKSALMRLPRTTRDIHCVSGTLWITQDGDPRDIVLEAGQQFRPDRDAGTIVHALAPAQLTLHHAPQGRSQGKSRSARFDPQGQAMRPRGMALE